MNVPIKAENVLINSENILINTEYVPIYLANVPISSKFACISKVNISKFSRYLRYLRNLRHFLRNFTINPQHLLRNSKTSPIIRRITPVSKRLLNNFQVSTILTTKPYHRQNKKSPPLTIEGRTLFQLIGRYYFVISFATA